MDSLAIHERGYLFPSPGSAKGVRSECPFCIARHITEYRTNDIGMMLHMLDAGRLLTYKSSELGGAVDLFEWIDRPGSSLRLMREHWLTLPLEVITVPFWLPGLSLRNCFIIDELAVWFCSESAAGEGFYWDDDRMIEIVRTCWRRRLPIRSAELSKVLLAHGMPEQYQDRTEHLFAYGMATLIASQGRLPMKKLRAEQTAAQHLYETWKLK